MKEFGEAISRATSSSRKSGKIYKIILFGSYARDDWVDEPENGYQSDFDLLVVVSHRDLTDIEHYWYIAEDKIQRDEAIGRPVNIIVHSLDEVNQALGRGEYFWTDIASDGIALYELPCHPLATPMPLTRSRRPSNGRAAISTSILSGSKAFDRPCRFENSDQWMAATKPPSLLHQATERVYICFLLVRTLYFPRSHNVKFLRSLSEDKEPRLIAAGRARRGTTGAGSSCSSAPMSRRAIRPATRSAPTTWSRSRHRCGRCVIS